MVDKEDSLISVARKPAGAALVTVVCALGLLAGAGSALAATKTFTYTGKEQEFKVPAGVTSIEVVAVGSEGGTARYGAAGGVGAIVTGDLPVKPEQVLYVEVGGAPFNGGGLSRGNGGSGGGASDARTVSIGAEPSPGNEASLLSRLLVAAGGGGGGNRDDFFGRCPGGAGGAAEEKGANGTNCGEKPGEGGGAGKAKEGGAGGKGYEREREIGPPWLGEAGRLGVGGAGQTGGGGGGGLYGGGGGGSQRIQDYPKGEIAGNGGGGGGSNLVPQGGKARLAKAKEPASVAITYTVTIGPTATSLKCSPPLLVAGQSASCTATVKDEAKSGATAPTGSVGFKTSGEGSLEGTCELKAATSSSSSCSATYKPSPTPKTLERTDTITATYEGDEAHAGSKGTAAVTVITPAPIPPVIPSAIAATPPPPSVAPVLSGLTAVRRCVTSAVLEHARAGSGGLAFSFTLSQAANVTFAVLHRVGSPAWTRCPSVRGHAPSTYRSVGEVGALDPAGQQTNSLGSAARARPLATVVPLAPGRHRISLAQIAQKRLPPGTYVVSAKAVNSAGKASSVEYAKFWVFS
jgi:hypothetical protein